MALVILQSGSSLQRLNDDGELLTLTLPTGVTLQSTIPPRWTVYGNYAILVNTPSRPLTIDGAGVVRVLTPTAPRVAPVLSGPSAGSLSGTYKAKLTNCILDDDGNVIAESDYSAESAAVTISSKILRAASLDICPDDIDQRRLSRTTTAGATFFPWVHVDGNTITSIDDGLSDLGLGQIAVPRRGSPPRLVLIAEFRGRLFGVGDTDRNEIRYTEAGEMYAWPADNEIVAPAKGADAFGVVAFAPRRDALGIGRRNMLAQIVGTGEEDATGAADFSVVVLSKEVGIESQESVCIYRDAAYFLWKDGVYRWDSSGVTCLSDQHRDGRPGVRSWFATDDYFNRDQYPYAFAHLDPNCPNYRLFLCSAGSTTIDRWVEYHIDDDTWWGPHSTSLFTPTSAFLRTNDANRTTPLIGAAAAVYQEQETRTDGASTAISFDIIGKRHDGGDPDREKFFGAISILGAAQASGTLSIVARVGAVNATTSTTQSMTLSNTRQRLNRLGVGKHAQIEMTQATAGVDVEIYGYVIDPVHLVGRR